VNKNAEIAGADNNKTGHKKPFPIPLSLIAIDGVGAMLVAWGFYLYISESRSLFHIGAGFMLMAPLIISLLRLSTSQRNKG
jgi:hypothetical protein